MPEIVANCPRCDSKKITFNVRGENLRSVQYDWLHIYEAFCTCRECKKSTIFIVKQSDIAFTSLLNSSGLMGITGSLSGIVEVDGVVSIKDFANINAPDGLPEDIKLVFEEGARCLAVQCYNAAGTMFRLCLDLATKSLLPEGDAEGLNYKTRRDLGLRLPWLFEVSLLPKDLQELSSCIKDDGNDGAHAGTLTKHDAEDLLDFTDALLTRIYTEPARLQTAKMRREARRG